ncbi:thrombospondin type 3 repeat-containing protein [Flavobacteriaceae bacterium]|nr:thrombospondin type 3 repeat-containing protein [Flavobacteriaceae bacterium]
MKKFHFTLILFLIIQSVFSQVNIKVNRGDHISIIDTLKFELSLEKLLDTYSLEDIYDKSQNPSVEFEFTGITSFFMSRDKDFENQRDSYWPKETTYSILNQFKEKNNNSNRIKLNLSADGKSFIFHSNNIGHEFFTFKNNEYVVDVEFTIIYNGFLLSDDDLCNTGSSKGITGGECQKKLNFQDKITNPFSKKIFLDKRIKTNLKELVDKNTEDLMLPKDSEGNSSYWQGKYIHEPIRYDFNKDGLIDIATRFYHFAGDATKELSYDEIKRQISRWGIFFGTNESTKDSLVFRMDEFYDEKSEGTNLTLIDFDGDGDMDIFTKPDVYHGKEFNRPPWYFKDGIFGGVRPSFVYFNQGNGKFVIDSLQKNVAGKSLIQLDSDPSFEAISLGGAERNNNEIIKYANIQRQDFVDGQFEVSSIYSTDRTYLNGNAILDVNGDGYDDMVLLSQYSDFPEGSDYSPNKNDLRDIYIDYYSGSKDSISLTLSNRKKLYDFKLRPIQGFEQDPISVIDFNGRKIAILWIIRNGYWKGDIIDGVEATYLKAIELVDGGSKDVTEEFFPDNIHTDNIVLGSDPEYRDVDNDGDIDIVWTDSAFNSNDLSAPLFLNNGNYFEAKYFPHWNMGIMTPGRNNFDIYDIDSDGISEMVMKSNQETYILIDKQMGEFDELLAEQHVFEIIFHDFDFDGIEDSKDNCPDVYNPDQMDSDGDGFGDICDNYEDTFSIESSEIIEDVVIVSSEFQQLVDNEGYNNYNRNYFGTNNSYDYKDFNGDGFKDLIIVSNYQPEIGHIAGIFLWNNENKKYEDLTSHIMISRGDAHFYGKTVYDFDDDGDLDVYLPSHNYHGEDGKQPDYYQDQGQRYPAHFFINEESKFTRKIVDSTIVDLGDKFDFPAYDQAFLIDLDNNNKKELLNVVINSGYPEKEGNYFFTNYSIDKNKNISKEFIFPWTENTRYEGQYHSLLAKEDDKNIYVYTQPKELWINNGSYSYPEVWIYKKDGKFDSKDPQKIKLKRNKNLRNAGSIINRETFYIEDLDGDGNQEIIIGMFEEPFENGEHASIHVFNLNGSEITDTWFNEREFIDNTGSAHNGFVVKDFNNDGFSDLVVNARFNSEDKEIPLFMNTGKKFKKFNINKVKDGWHMPVDIDNDSIYEFLTFNSKDDPSNISSVVKINYSGFDNDNDDDGIVNSLDNCPDTSNPDQKDSDGDGIGDVCDDSDGDGVLDLDDQCPFTNPDETVNENGCSETELNIDNSSGLVVANNQIGKKFLTDLYSFEIQEGNCPSTEDDIANGDCFNCSVRYFIWEDNYIIFDYNNDGKDDLFAFLINGGEDGIFQSDENPTGKLMFYDNYLSGLTEPQYFESEIVWGGWLDVNDFNGDGFYDILVTANNSHEVSKVTNEQFENIPFEIFFFDSNGFSERKVLDMENASSNGPMSGDIDKDGDIDIIQPKIKTDEDKRSYVLVNDGNGNFSQNFKFLTEIENKQERLEMSDHGQILYDINKDGCLDWIVPVMNNGKFVIEEGKLIEKEIDGGGPTEYDDLIYINGEYVKSGSRILWGDCSGNYSFENSNYFDQHQDYLLSELSEYNFETLYGALSYNVFDYNNDGVNDIILSKNYHNRATGLQLFKGNSDGSYSDVTQDTFDKFFFKKLDNNGLTIESNFPRIWNIAVKDKDGDGDLDLIPWGMSEFQDRCWKDWLSGEEYWEFVNGKFYFRSDKDLDGVYDHLDNCPETANEDQADTDGDGMGDVCDNDIDGDGILNDSDNCFETANEDQSDIDGDGIGDVCDDDIDGDGILNDSDNCPETVNKDQADMDGDGIGDVCDDDKDGDTILNTDDNCPETAN